MKKILVLSLVVLPAISAHAARRPADAPVGYHAIQIVDVPTADVVDHYGYDVSFRFGKAGALQAKPVFGVFPRLNIGFGLDGENIIGTGDADMNKPTINVKFRAYDGKGWIPAVALGFDGQGYYYNDTRDEYEQREKGFFLVGTSEVLVPELFWTYGLNVFDFDESDATRGFTGLAWTWERTLGLFAEYDSLNKWRDRRVNFGLKYFVSPAFTIEAVGRDVPRFFGRSERETERIIRLAYRGAF